MIESLKKSLEADPDNPFLQGHVEALTDAEEKAARPLDAAACSASSFLTEIAAEIDRATIKFPTWPTDPIHAANVVMEEAGELSKEVNQLTYEPHKSSKEWVRKEAIQTAAMAIRFLMSLDRYEFTPGPQHSQQNAELTRPESKPQDHE